MTTASRERFFLSSPVWIQYWNWTIRVRGKFIKNVRFDLKILIRIFAKKTHTIYFHVQVFWILRGPVCVWKLLCTNEFRNNLWKPKFERVASKILFFGFNTVFSSVSFSLLKTHFYHYQITQVFILSVALRTVLLTSSKL